VADVGAKRQEERVKLAASALSNIGVAAIVSGAVAPLATGRFIGPIAFGGLLVGLGFHLVAQVFLHYVAIEHDAEADR
jgi:hypothetical protein